MKIKLLLPTALCGVALFVTGCVYDEGYSVRRVTVSGGSPYYYGPYDSYTPYYSYSGRRYYRSGGRYVYYSDRRPYYVNTVPRRAVYINPPVQTTVRGPMIRHHRHHHDHD